MSQIYRLIDANLNRVSEGIRVIEDIARFRFNHKNYANQARNFRHRVRKLFIDTQSKLIAARDSHTDVGKEISSSNQLDQKGSLKDLVLSNFKRIQEGCRVIEENLKLVGLYHLGKEIESVRFSIYTFEKQYMNFFKNELPKGIYGITAEKFSRGRKNIDVVQQMIKGGIRVIQYREKYPAKSFKEIYSECKEIRKITRNEGVVFIINDYIDIAMMVDADGVHIGQDDLPAREVRKLIGDKLLGLSTHSPEQARESLSLPVDYIGVGPIFGTNLKEDVCPAVGVEYLDYVVANIDMPFVAIGGIKEHNVGLIAEHGAETICLVTEIVGAEDIVGKIRRLYEITENATNF